VDRAAKIRTAFEFVTDDYYYNIHFALKYFGFVNTLRIEVISLFNLSSVLCPYNLLRVYHVCQSSVLHPKGEQAIACGLRYLRYATGA